MSGQGRRRSALPLQRQEVASTSAQTLAAIQDASEAGSKLGNSKCTTAQYEYRKRVFKQWTADNQIETGWAPHLEDLLAVFGADWLRQGTSQWGRPSPFHVGLCLHSSQEFSNERIH